MSSWAAAATRLATRGGIQATFATGAGPGGGPNVQRFKNANGTPAGVVLRLLHAFHGGVFVAQGDFHPLDTDHDGLSDAREVQLGTSINSADTDSDGLPDYVETSPNCPPDGSHPACPHGGAGIDTDQDGKIDALDTDSDNDGTPDGNAVEGTGDCDKNGVPNYRDAGPAMQRHHDHHATPDHDVHHLTPESPGREAPHQN